MTLRQIVRRPWVSSVLAAEAIGLVLFLLVGVPTPATPAVLAMSSVSADVGSEMPSGIPQVRNQLPARLRPIAVVVWERLQNSKANITDYGGFELADRKMTLEFFDRSGDFYVVVELDPAPRITSVRGDIPAEVAKLELPGELLAIPDLNETPGNEEVTNVRIEPRTDGDTGYAVVFNHFYTGDLPSFHGDICDVYLDLAGNRVVDGERIFLEAPTAEGARDAVTTVEFGGMEDLAQAQPSVGATVDCVAWNGPGLQLSGTPSFTFSEPGGEVAASLDEASSTVGWVVVPVNWVGEDFPTTWQCEGFAYDQAGAVVASGVGRLYRANHYDVHEYPDQFNLAVEVEVFGDPRSIRSGDLDCGMVNPEY